MNIFHLLDNFRNYDETPQRESVDRLIVIRALTQTQTSVIGMGMNETSDNPDDLSFEDALKRLEEIVRKLESGDVPLDQSIDLYSQGEKLRNQCQKRLESAQARIEKITLDRDGKPQSTTQFDAD